MFKRKIEAKPVGAKEKLARAQEMKKLYDEESAQHRATGSVYKSQIIPLTVVFSITTILVSVLNSGSSELVFFYKKLISETSFTFITDSDSKKLAVTFSRSFLVFLLLYTIPFLGKLTVDRFSRGTLNPYVACMGVIVTIPLLITLFGRSLASVFSYISSLL